MRRTVISLIRRAASRRCSRSITWPPRASLEGRFDIDLADHGHCVDPDTLLFIDERVALVADPGLPRGVVQVTLTTRGDATVDIGVDHALGTPQRPAARAQVEDKFLRYAAPRLGVVRSKALLAELNGLDQAGDCADLLRLSRPMSSPSATRCAAACG